jgi:periplasmic protein TonB
MSRGIAIWTALVILSSGFTLRAQQAQDNSASPGPPTAQIAKPRRVRVSSGVVAKLLIKRVAPSYPEEAREQGLQGTVVVRALIGKTGDVENLQLVTGDPLLAEAALKAVKKWKYKPYLLNGDPVEVDTQIQVNFTLSGR